MVTDMRLSEILARSARPKQQRSLAKPKAKRLSTPIVVERRRQPRTKRSKRRNKVRAWQMEAANKNIDADIAAKYDKIDVETAMEMARDLATRGVELI